MRDDRESRLQKNSRGFWNRGRASLILGISVFVIFILSHNRDLADSNLSMLLSYQLIKNHTFRLDEYFQPPVSPSMLCGQEGIPYQVEKINRHVFYRYPPGSSILSIPVVAIFSYFGYGPSGPNDPFNYKNEKHIQTLIAALLMSISTVIIYTIAFDVIPFHWAITVAVAFAFGTQIWSTASRALWTNTWSIFFASILAIFMIRVKHLGLYEQILIGTILSWSYFTRPQSFIMIVFVVIYFFLLFKYKIAAIVITGCIWLAAFILYSMTLYGTFLPNYCLTNSSAFSLNFEGLAGVLVSPSRGICVYIPIIIFVFFLVVYFRKYIKMKLMLYLSSAVYITYTLFISSFVCWWGGHSFGPRLLSDVTPWLAVISIVGIDAMLRWKEMINPSKRKYVSILAFGSILLALSVFINFRGATSSATTCWNVTPYNIDHSSIQRWNWAYPQFLAGIIRAPKIRQ